MNQPSTQEPSLSTDDRPVWHLVAEVLPDNQVRTICGRTVERSSAGPSDVGRKCHACEAADT